MMELLFLTPISTRSLVLQKFLSACCIFVPVILIFLPTDVWLLGYGGISPSSIMLAYVMLAMSIACGIALGMLANCLLPNARFALPAACTAVTLIAFLLYGILLPLLMVPCYGGSHYSNMNNEIHPPDWWIIVQMTCIQPLIAVIAVFCLRWSINRIKCMRSPARYRRDAMEVRG